MLLEEAVHEFVEAVGIDSAHGGKLDTHADAFGDVADDSVAADFAFRYGEKDRDGVAEARGGVGLDEKAADVKVELVVTDALGLPTRTIGTGRASLSH